MTNPDPFKLPPGPVRQYVERAIQLAAKHEMDPSMDMEPGINEYVSDIHAQADALRPEADGPAFLAAVKGQLRTMTAGVAAGGRVAGDLGATRRMDTFGHLVGRLR